MLNKSVLAGLRAVTIGISGCATKVTREYTNGTLSKVEVTRYSPGGYLSYSISNGESLYYSEGFLRETKVSAYSSAFSISKESYLCIVTVERNSVITQLRGEAKSLNSFLDQQKNFADADLIRSLLKKGRQLMKSKLPAK